MECAYNNSVTNKWMKAAAQKNMYICLCRVYGISQFLRVFTFTCFYTIRVNGVKMFLKILFIKFTINEKIK